MESNPLFRNQRINLGLATAYGPTFQVHMRADLLQSTWQMQPLQLLEGITSDVLIPALTIEVLHTAHPVVAAVVCQGEHLPQVLECCLLRREKCNTFTPRVTRSWQQPEQQRF